jgi:hypothetical protein
MVVKARNIWADIRRRGQGNVSRGRAAVAKQYVEALKKGKLDPREWSIKECAKGFYGDGWEEDADPRSGIDTSRLVQMMEGHGGDAVSHTSFTNINKQIIYSAILQSFEDPMFTMSSVIPTEKTSFSTEMIPGMSEVGDVMEEVGEAMPYPEFGFGEDYIQTPKTQKYGGIISLTREAIFFDRTGLIIDRARRVGHWLAYRKEVRILRTFMGIDNTFSWLGTTYNTYQTTQWTNTQTNVLADWTDIEASEALLIAITDPWTGLPVTVIPKDLFVMPANVYKARNILNATEVRTVVSSNTTLSDNPVRGQYNAMTSRIAMSVLVASGVAASDAATYWWHGDFGTAFRYMENWPIRVDTQRGDSDAAFAKDIVLRYKASEMGRPAVFQPRVVIRNKN